MYDNVLIVTGAGMGVPSGFATFRGEDGLWPKIAEETGMAYQEWAVPLRFEEDPEQAWGFYSKRAQVYRSTPPHDGYHRLREWVGDTNHFVFTTNIDGHACQVFDDVVEIHGNINYLQSLWSHDNEPLTHWDNLEEWPEYKRPNVLLFDDYSFNTSRQGEQESRYNQWLKKIEGSRLVVEIGCGREVPTGRFEALKFGGTRIRVNPDDGDYKGIMEWLDEQD